MFRAKTTVKNLREDQLQHRYVACPCRHCGGEIEFDAKELGERESCPVSCPFCGLETEVSVARSCVDSGGRLPDQAIPQLQAQAPLIHYGKTAPDGIPSELVTYCERHG